MIRHGEFGYYYTLSKWRERYMLRHGERNFFSRHTHYANCTVYSAEMINRFLFQLIVSGKPFMAGRFGGTELSALKIFDFELLSKYSKCLAQMKNWSGFFPETEAAGRMFKTLMIGCIPEADILGVWGQPFEDYYIKRYGSKKLKSTYLFDLEPWSCEKTPWSAALKGKKVLIIHPFADTIKKQYQRREKLYPATEILPQFDLEVFKAVQTIAGETDDRFPDWFSALDWMCEEVLKKEFDIAVIGCGAYGFPLAARLKRAGKQAIHLGGAVQLLFGIKGKRWETDAPFGYVRKYFNNFWVYPNESERPRNAQTVEGGCYW